MHSPNAPIFPHCAIDSARVVGSFNPWIASFTCTAIFLRVAAFSNAALLMAHRVAAAWFAAAIISAVDCTRSGAVFAAVATGKICLSNSFASSHGGDCDSVAGSSVIPAKIRANSGIGSACGSARAFHSAANNSAAGVFKFASMS